MVVREFYETRSDGVNLYRTYSTDGKFLVQVETGLEYAEAIDVESSTYNYIEIDKEPV